MFKRIQNSLHVFREYAKSIYLIRGVSYRFRRIRKKLLSFYGEYAGRIETDVLGE
jgi:hypothetical protein